MAIAIGVHDAAEPISEQDLEQALRVLFDSELASPPRFMLVHPRMPGLLLHIRNTNWKRSAYLRRRRGWAPQ